MFNIFFRYLFSRDISAIYCPDDLFALEEVFQIFQINFENFSELADRMTPDSDGQDFDDPQVQVSFVLPQIHISGQEKGKKLYMYLFKHNIIRHLYSK